MKELRYARKKGDGAQPVYFNGQVFDKIYLTKEQIKHSLGKSQPWIKSQIDKGEILQFEIRGKKVFIVRNDFIKFLIKND